MTITIINNIDELLNGGNEQFYGSFWDNQNPFNGHHLFNMMAAERPLNLNLN